MAGTGMLAAWTARLPARRSRIDVVDFRTRMVVFCAVRLMLCDNSER